MPMVHSPLQLTDVRRVATQAARSDSGRQPFIHTVLALPRVRGTGVARFEEKPE